MTDDKIDIQKMIAGVIIQAIRDLDIVKPFAYREDKEYEYGSEEAMNWLQTYGVDLLVSLGHDRQSVVERMKDPKGLLQALEGLTARGLTKE